MTRTSSGLLALMLLAGPLHAQGPLVKYGKWLLVAGSIGMNYYAVRAHNRAEDNFDALEKRCLAKADQLLGFIVGKHGSLGAFPPRHERPCYQQGYSPRFKNLPNRPNGSKVRLGS